MDSKEKNDLNSIDAAIQECKEKVDLHRKRGYIILMSVIIFITAVVTLIIAFIFDSSRSFSESNVGTLLIYILFAFVIMVFGVFMSIYRFHLKEAAKYEHLQVGFLRVRVAGNNTKVGYQSEVRISLTENAFNFELSNMSRTVGTNKTVANPLPGYPTADVSTLLIKKLLDNLEFKKKEEENQ